jgi:hypothetical protein
MCYVVILAEDTADIATTEKESAGTTRTCKTWLFPLKESRSRSAYLISLTAETNMTVSAVCVAVPGAERAVVHI